MKIKMKKITFQKKIFSTQFFKFIIDNLEKKFEHLKNTKKT